MKEEVKCFGCGAVIQSEHAQHIGYVPKAALEKDHILCQRCFKLNHYHQRQETSLTKDDFLSILQTIGDKDCLVVYIIDLFDFNGSLIQGLTRHIGNNDILVLANKRDILPKSVKETKIEHWVRRQLKEEGIKPVDVIISSGKKNMNLDDIFDSIMEHSHGRDVYVVGVTNVGKSTLINSLIKHYSDAEQFITVSEFPGTTLNLIEIPLNESSTLYDTPGIINDSQITHLVDTETLQAVMPRSELRPMVYQLNPGQSLYIGGLARVDYEEGDQANFIVYVSRDMQIHRTKTVNADELYNRHKQLKFEVPGIDTIDQMKTYSLTLDHGKKDIVISGLGFVTISSTGAKIKVKAPSMIDVFVRESLI